MKAKYVIAASVCTLLLLVFLQGAGMRYAYTSLMERSRVSFDACFKQAFCEQADEQVNLLPYPAGTMTHLTYVPDSLHLGEADRLLYYAQQTSAILQDAYRQPAMPLDSLYTKLLRYLDHEGVSADIVIRKLDTATGHTLQTVPAGAVLPSSSGIGVLTSPRIFLHQGRGVAVEAVARLGYFRDMRGLWLLIGATLILLAAVVVIFLRHIRALVRQQHSVQTQQQDFYQLAESMTVPLHRLESDLHSARWPQAGDEGRHLLADTEATLTRAKAENAHLRLHRMPSSYILAVAALMGVFLLLGLWESYVYREQWRTASYVAQICFEQAFLDDTYRRGLQSAEANRLNERANSPFRSFTPYYQHQLRELMPLIFEHCTLPDGRDTLVKKPYSMGAGVVRFHPLYKGYGPRLYMAYDYLKTVDENPIYIPLDTLRLDSLFRAELRQAGMEVGSGLRVLRKHGQEEMKRVGDIAPLDSSSFLTTPLRLTEDNSVVVQGLIPAPQRYVVRSAWYLFLPLGLLLLFSLFCVGGLWYVWRRLRRLEQFRKDFTYAMIHDMKSPLQSILMGTQILSSGKLAEKPERAARILSGMLDECAHLFTLSNRVITLTQIDRGTLELHPEHLALRPLLDDLTAKFTLKSTKPLTFQVDCPEDFTIYADAFCLREVLSNLIDNAIKYSGNQVTIRFTASSTPTATLLRIADNGLGIAPRDLPLIFRKYERAAATSRSSRGGASGFGLGLNFVRQVVEAHGGYVTVSSTVGAGTEFTVSLPHP